MTVDPLTKLRSSAWALFAALVVIAGVAMYRWIVSPHMTYLMAVERYEPVVNQVIQEKRTLRDTLEARRQMLDQMKGQFEDLQHRLFSPEQAHTFFSDLERMARDCSCVIDEVTRLDTVGSGEKSKDPVFIETLRAKLTIMGYYSGMVRFVQRLESHERKIWLDSLDMVVMQTQDSLLRCDLVITIYVFKDKEAASHGEVQ